VKEYNSKVKASQAWHNAFEAISNEQQSQEQPSLITQRLQ